ncbi:hypothetical protein D8M04_00115 [Oceanobacillus piezotolerans]|uniref:HMA domain-containing protein n=1 Tax=Oceanobacillus piezotolerans TaxID=2448030 RepID=A0A498DCG0_9BACI|nr:hypothetical protein [Oceanobacillus piezotolerans]RLL47726.1 hypothetical protein D8M04_00115 [Oceanobacillus piezotolerans]
MAQTTFFVKEATSEPFIGQIEELLSQYDGMERILIDTDDGEIKIQFDDSKITPEQIATALMEENYFIH